MKLMTTTLTALAIVLCAGCAQTRSTAMGAGPSPSATASSGPSLICRDGYWTAPGGSCGDHGGTERALAR